MAAAPDRSAASGAYRFIFADVFTDRPYAGNQLAVLPQARGLSAAQMQQIAREFNFSETIFVFPPENAQHTWRVRIFTPAAEIPFAGHPTVGCAIVLAHIGEVPLDGAGTAEIVLEENAGPVPVSIRRGEGRAAPLFAQLTAAQPPQVGPVPPANDKLAAMLSLGQREIGAGEKAPVPMAISCGVPFLLIPLASIDAVRRCRLDLQCWEATLRGYWTPDVFIFALAGERPGSDVHARMFAPGFNIAEDPATGSACAALAGYLAMHDASLQRTKEATGRWRVEQGFEMGRPSILDLEADVRSGCVSAVRVGGHAVIVAQGVIEAPAEGDRGR